MARPRGDSAAALKVSKSHHRATDSGAKRKPSHEVREKRGARASASRSPEKEKRSHNRNSATSQTSSNVLSIDSLAKLNAENEKTGHGGHYEEKQKEKVATGRIAKDRGKHRKKKRVVSGAILEEGRGGRARGRRGGYVPTEGPRRKYGRRFWIMVGVIILLLIILIPVGVVLARKKSGSGGSGGSSGAAKPSNSELGSISQEDIPPSAKGGILDPFTWYDTKDFNVTYTEVLVGGLPVMGLKSKYDDTTKANEFVPALNERWPYGTLPIRGVNIGGWLSIEPFITPSLFNYQPNMNIVDEYTLCEHLGASEAAQTLEKHYASFVTEQTFADIKAAGLDHVRIPFSYWAVTTYPGDPYVPKISWRYLLRGIEWARKHGLRVNLDLHGVPGSQNGWNHSGRQGSIGWLNGTDGALNGQRSLDIHNQLSTFFAQDRYKNVVTIYGLVNEPKMTLLPVTEVLAWTTNAIQLVRKNGIRQTIAFGDGFLGIPNWQGKLQGIENLVMDAHQYVIFNVDQIAFTHQNKLKFACSGWTAQMVQSSNPATGFGPTFCGEWSQADTDCAQFLNNVNVGSRWTGTMNTQDPKTQVLSPTCPSAKTGRGAGSCSCAEANAAPASYSPVYKQFLQMFAEAQMVSFEQGWGWFYWTWETEKAVQWSWKLGLKAGILPRKAYAREFNCTQDIPTFEDLPENY
ncbi:hypothetical protein MMC16_003611 [Acarospora aff. strigata]|nr:hypothetical protein [Acarospora aff. strigata]